MKRGPLVALSGFFVLGEDAKSVCRDPLNESNEYQLVLRRGVTVKRIEQGRIPYRKVGGRLLFDADEIIEWTKRKR